MRFLRFIAPSSISVCLGAVAPAYARPLVVDNDSAECPQAEFNSIQAAVEMAEPGDKILVCAGTYMESVLVNKSDLRIEAQAAPGEVVLQGTRAQPFGFHLLNTTGVLLQGFTVQEFGRGNIRIQGGMANTVRKNVATLGFIDGIQVIMSSANLVEHNIASLNNKTPNSDGIFVSGSTNNIFHQNQSFGNGQVGINLVDSDGNVARENETFLNRTSGINMLRSRGNVAFHNNSHENGLRGIQNAGQSHRNVIENNRLFANAQGGIFIGNSTEVIARNNRIENNTTFGIRLQNGAANKHVENNDNLRNNKDGIQHEKVFDQYSKKPKEYLQLSFPDRLLSRHLLTVVTAV
jgi:parallel beta-helix repeat protein